MLKLFVGYRNTVSEEANLLKNILQAMGIKIWLYEEELLIGSQFLDEIEQLIQNDADGSLFLLEDSVLKSEFMNKLEIPKSLARLGNDKKFKVFPVYIKEYDNIKEKGQFAKRTDIQYHELKQTDFENILELCKDVVKQLLKVNYDKTMKKIPMEVSDFEESESQDSIMLNCYFGYWSKKELGFDNEKRNKLLKILEGLKSVLSELFETKVLVISGNLSYTTAFILGYSFRAVTNYTFIMNYFGEKWKTERKKKGKKSYIKDINPVKTVVSDLLIVDLSITHNNENKIEEYVIEHNDKFKNKNENLMRIIPIDGSSGQSIKNEDELKGIVLETYQKISEIKNELGIQTIHLFVSAPFPLVIFLGWLWNSMPNMCIYEFDNSTQSYISNPNCIN